MITLDQWMCYLKLAYIIEQKQKEAQEKANAKPMGGAMATRTEGGIATIPLRNTVLTRYQETISRREGDGTAI